MKKYLSKYEIRWAIIISILTFIWIVFEHEIGLHNGIREFNPFISLLFIFPAFLFYIFFFIDKKRRRYKNRLKFEHAFLSGVVLTIILFILNFPLQYIVYSLFPPLTEDSLLNSDEIIFKNDFTLAERLIYWPMFTLIFGFIFSIILGLIYKKKRKRKRKRKSENKH